MSRVFSPSCPAVVLDRQQTCRGPRPEKSLSTPWQTRRSGDAPERKAAALAKVVAEAVRASARAPTGRPRQGANVKAPLRGDPQRSTARST